MSATRDKSQKVTFVYSNLYSIYRKGVERAREGAIRESAENSPSRAAQAIAETFGSGVVIKPGDARQAPPPAPPGRSAPVIRSYTPAELVGRSIAKPAVLREAQAATAADAASKSAKSASPDAIASLKQNLESLNDLQARLRFMLKELEDLIKD
jgi:hypothetical protein